MSRCNDEWMQAAHEYYLRHATSEVGHRSPICSPCLRRLWAVWSADRSSGRNPDGAESDQHGRDFEFIERGIVISDGTHKVITNRGCDSLHSWEMIGSVWSDSNNSPVTWAPNSDVNWRFRSKRCDWSRMFGCFQAHFPAAEELPPSSTSRIGAPATACCHINIVRGQVRAPAGECALTAWWEYANNVALLWPFLLPDDWLWLCVCVILTSCAEPAWRWRVVLMEEEEEEEENG